MFLDKAVACTKDKVLRSVSEVFGSWATDFVNALEPKVEEVSARLLKTSTSGWVMCMVGLARILHPDFYMELKVG